jgi:uncharacterized protein YbjT (DUF2867 family)
VPGYFCLIKIKNINFMKITLTGSLGNVSKPLAIQLIAAGHHVTVISSKPARAADIEALGATAAIGSVADTGFLVKTFTGADVVYTMVPPDLSVSSLLDYFSITGRNYAAAVGRAGVPRVVNLSSMGAHLHTGVGPIAGARNVEDALNSLPGVAVKHLRAPFFYFNFYNSMDMIRQMGVLGNNYPAHTKLIMVHPADLAKAAAEEIEKGFAGKSVLYVWSDERSAGEVAAVLGAAIGKPELPWVEFSDEQALQGMMQGGMPEEFARMFVEVGAAVRSGIIWEDYRRSKDLPAEGRKLEAFAKEFAAAFRLTHTPAPAVSQ